MYKYKSINYPKILSDASLRMVYRFRYAVLVGLDIFWLMTPTLTTRKKDKHKHKEKPKTTVIIKKEAKIRC